MAVVRGARARAARGRVRGALSRRDPKSTVMWMGGGIRARWLSRSRGGRRTGSREVGPARGVGGDDLPAGRDSPHL